MIRTTTLAALPVLAIVAGGVLAGCANPAADPQSPREIVLEAAQGSAQPHLEVDETGAVALSWLEPAEDGTALRLSAGTGDIWSAPTTVATGARTGS